MDGQYARADRLNTEPPIFRGCSSSELGVILLAGSLFWLPTALLLATLLGMPSAGLGGAAMAIVGSTFVGTTVFRRIKRARPDGYYQLRLVLLLHDLGLRRSPFFRKTGVMDLGRRIPPF